MAKAAVIGLGEVGSALYKVLSRVEGLELYGYDLDPSRSPHRLEDIPRGLDYLHIAYPFTGMDAFVSSVAGYVKRLKPRVILIHSTVAPGVTRAVEKRTGTPTVYSPVRGKHPCLDRHLLFWTKWLAGLDESAVEEAARHLSSAGLKTRVCRCPPETLELAKLWETVYRAVMIAAWQELHRMALRFGADVAAIAEFIAEVHEVLRDRPVYYPGVIGGHCLIPNTRILRSVYPSKLLDFILESNEVRREEIHDPRIEEDVEAVKRVADRLSNTDYYRCV